MKLAPYFTEGIQDLLLVATGFLSRCNFLARAFEGETALPHQVVDLLQLGDVILGEATVAPAVFIGLDVREFVFPETDQAGVDAQLLGHLPDRIVALKVVVRRNFSHDKPEFGPPQTTIFCLIAYLGSVRMPRRILDYGPQALLLEWEQRIAPDINRSVLAYAAYIENLDGVVECVPAYASLLLRVDKNRRAWRELLYDVRVPDPGPSPGTLHRLPVRYGGSHGPDLDEVAARTGLSVPEVIDLHTGQDYQVYLLGFRPGFGFLGQLPAPLEVARRVSPRPRVSAGSVGLAGRQTGVYPVDSPGGWQLIGHCPLPLLDSAGGARLQPGDRVRFFPIDSCTDNFPERSLPCPD